MASRLPVEIISHIMRYLSVSDRKEACLVSRAWYEASLDPYLQKDILINFSIMASKDKESMNLRRRKMPHLVITEMDNSSNYRSTIINSCEQLNENLQSISFKSSNITECTFVIFLSKCTNVVSLDLSCCNSLFMSGALLAKNADIMMLKNSLKKIRCLNLSSIRYLSDATFNRIVTVCDNLEKLSVASVQLTFNSGIYYPKGSTKLVNNAVITFENVLNFIKIQNTKLIHLDLSKTALNNEALGLIAKIDGLKLQEIILVGCREISDEGISELTKHQTSLVYLDLSACQEVGNGSLKCICADLGANLQVLKLSRCKKITDDSIQHLKLCTSLTTLELTECYQVTSAGLLVGLCSHVHSNLTHLNLSCCSHVTDKFVLSLCKYLKYLVYLDLGSCFPLTDCSVTSISRSLKYLRHLRLSWCKEISDLGLLGFESQHETRNNDQHMEHGEHGLCRCTRQHHSTNIFRRIGVEENGVIKRQNSGTDLEMKFADTEEKYELNNISGLVSLDLSSCTNLTDLGIMQVIKFKELRSLHLGMVHLITDKSVISIAENNPSLEELHLSQCAAITDASIKVISEKLHRLSYLDIFGCDGLTDKCIQYLHDCKRLKYLNVSFCLNLSVSAVEYLESSLTSLQTVEKRLVGGNKYI